MNSKQERQAYWQENAKYMTSLKGKKELTPDEWKIIVYETWAIYWNHKTGPVHGGTLSSQNLRVAKNHLELLKSGIKMPEVFGREHPNLDDLVEHTTQILDAAKSGLESHNAQSDKFFGYDMETGEPIVDEPITTTANDGASHEQWEKEQELALAELRKESGQDDNNAQ